MRSISEYGAQLKLNKPESAPDTFELLIELDAIKVKCEIVWRGDDQIGIKFISDFEYVKPTRAQVLKDSTTDELD